LRESELIIHGDIKARLMFVLLCAELFMAGGCQQVGYLLYLTAPAGGGQTIEPEFTELDGAHVAVAVYADQRVQYEYPFARLTLSSAVSAELEKQLKYIKIMELRRTISFQDENLYWETLDKTEVAKSLGADYLLQITLLEYSTRDPGSLNLYRGRISAQVSIYDAAKGEQQAGVWHGTINIAHPASSPAGVPAENDIAICEQTEKIFAQTLVRKFYKHKAVDQEVGQ